MKYPFPAHAVLYVNSITRESWVESYPSKAAAMMAYRDARMSRDLTRQAVKVSGDSNREALP